MTELFAEKLWDEFRYPAMAPFSGTVFDLKENEFIEKTVGIPIQKESAANAGTLRTRSSGNAVFDRLVAAGQRLLTVITRNKGGAKQRSFQNLLTRSTVSATNGTDKAVRWLEERLCY